MSKAAKQPTPQPTAYLDGQALVPHIDTESDVGIFFDSFPQFANLSNMQMVVMKAIATDLVSDNVRSDTQLADDLGIDRGTLWNYRNNPLFRQALGILMVGCVLGKTDKYIKVIEQAAYKGSWQASKFLLELSGVYVQKYKNLNVNVDATPVYAESQDFDSVVNDFIIALGSAGWSAQQILARYNELRSQGAW